MSLAFVFGAMAEFALVLFVQRNMEQENTTIGKHYDGFDSDGKVSPKSMNIGEELGKTEPHKETGNWADDIIIILELVVNNNDNGGLLLFFS